MTKTEVMKFLKSHGSEQIKNMYKKHGAREPFDGVKVSDLKTIVKKVKKDHALAMELYDTGNSDAMYLAGLIAEPDKMTKAHLGKWLKGAYWYFLNEFTVPWVASESDHGNELATKWIESKNEDTAAAGWATFSSLVAIKPDAELDLKALENLLGRVGTEIHQAPNRVRHTMNAFVIAVGSTVKPLTKKALATGKKIGLVKVDMGGTACKVPGAVEYIQKVEKRGSLGKKRTSARC